MTKTTIELAREVGATKYVNRHYPENPHNTFSLEQLEKFTTLVRSQRDSELLAGVGEPIGYVSEHTTQGPYQWQFSKTAAGVYKDTAKTIGAVFTRDQVAAAVLRADQAGYLRGLDEWVEFSDLIEKAIREVTK